MYFWCITTYLDNQNCAATLASAITLGAPSTCSHTSFVTGTVTVYKAHKIVALTASLLLGAS